MARGRRPLDLLVVRGPNLSCLPGRNRESTPQRQCSPPGPSIAPTRVTSQQTHRRAQERRAGAPAVGQVHGQRRLARPRGHGPQPRPYRRPARRPPTWNGPPPRRCSARCSPCPAVSSTAADDDTYGSRPAGPGPTPSLPRSAGSTPSRCAADQPPRPDNQDSDEPADQQHPHVLIPSAHPTAQPAACHPPSSRWTVDPG